MNTKKTVKSTVTNGSTAAGRPSGTKVPLRGAGNVPSSVLTTSGTLSQSRAKTQSQEDLTKPKERPSSRPKYTPGASASSHGSTRRPLTSKEGTRSSAERTPRDKARPSSSSSTGAAKTASSTSSSTRSSVASQRRKEQGAARGKPESEKSDKAVLEAKIKDLMTMAKGKDTEIKALKQKLDTMTTLLEHNQGGVDSNDEGTSNASESPPHSARVLESSTPVASSRQGSDAEDATTELQILKDENLKLKEQLDAMMLSMRQKTDTEKSLMLLHRQTAKHPQNDADASSHDGEALSSSIEDLASSSIVSPTSRGTSRSASAENLVNDAGSNYDSCSRADDKVQSDGSENSSAAAVVCLTEKIHRMEESQISTNEELEATVQELTDLQKSVPELTTDNNRLRQEKHYLMQRLCDTEKRLEQKESEVQHLRVLLNDRMRDDPDKPSVEQQYMQLLDEREHLLDIQEETSNQLRSAKEKLKEAHGVATAYEEQTRKLERELASITTERNRLEKNVQELKDTEGERKHNASVQHLEDSLTQEREKVAELLKKQAAMAVGDAHSSDDLVALIDELRNEKHDVEEKYLTAEDEIQQVKEENEKLDDRVAELEEELEAAGAKTKKDLSELSEVIDHLQEEIRVRMIELEEAKETIFIMEDAVEQHMAVKKHDNHMVSKLQAQMSAIKEEKFRLGKEIHQLKKEQKTQSEEWKQFQADLQMAVMIANDMKAETQAEVARLREENQALDERITKLQVENEQLRRRRKTTSSINLRESDLRPGQRSVEKELAVLRESLGVSRRAQQHSPGVQSLIKSFDNHAEQQQKSSPPGSPVSPTGPPIKKPTMSDNSPFASAAKFSPSKSLAGMTNPQKIASVMPTTNNSPATAEVTPIQRHHSMSSLTPQHSPMEQQPTLAKVATQSKPSTPEGKRNSTAADLSQLSSLLLSREKRTSSNPDSRKQSFESRKPLSDLLLDRLSPSNQPSSPTPSVAGSTGGGRDSPIHPAPTPAAPAAAKRHRAMSTPSGDSLATLARRYGGSKRNALLKWCQEKTKAYAGIDITNFSSSWNDGLAFCALVHAHLPAHIPYENLQQQLVSATDPKTKATLQAKNFRLAFAAAESVGIEPSLKVEEMASNDRPDWQRVMRYVTEIYNYFEI